jgi:Skp family chaperone for outer membrane proteins
MLLWLTLGPLRACRAALPPRSGISKADLQKLHKEFEAKEMKLQKEVDKLALESQKLHEQERQVQHAPRRVRRGG